MEPAVLQGGVEPPFAWYREFVPGEALRAHVYALFSFTPRPAPAPRSRPVLREVAFRQPIVCAPQFADGHVSIRFELGRACDREGRWRAEAGALGGTVVGPMSGVGRTAGLDFSETVGAYFRPGGAAGFFDVPMSELADTTVAVDDLWGRRGSWSSELADLEDAARLDRVESMLLAHVRQRRRGAATLDVEGLAAAVLRRAGRVTIDGMANAAGVSRQHLAREFRARIGIAPKLYGRLARFHSLLAHASARGVVDWAGVALDAGFADQSHMIAECRQFSGLTPRALAAADWFHPFIERAKSRPPG
jgi:AraC-like DNA-binding protein